MKIGSFEIQDKVTLAPMAGTSDLPYRIICSKMGASMVTTELISAKGIYYKNENTLKMLETSKEESIRVIQLFGSEPDVMLEACKMIEHMDFEIIDINMGCPAPKVVRNGEGSALMTDPVLAGKIVETLVNGIKKPVTVKIRKGYDQNSVNAVEFAKAMESSGASSIAVHGRVRTQFYSGESDIEIIKAVKEAVKINVIGNGDITDIYKAKHMLDYTGVDGIMIGRASMGNPFIFREVNAYINDGIILAPPSVQERMEMAIHHAIELCKFKGEFIGVREMRSHLGHYTKGMKDSSSLRLRINGIESLDELIGLLQMQIEINQ